MTQVVRVCACSHTHKSLAHAQFSSRDSTHLKEEAEICVKLPVLSLNQTTFIFKNLENIEKVERKNRNGQGKMFWQNI